MPTLTEEKPPRPAASHRVRELAEKLERHIRASDLKPGDRYLSAEEGGRLLGESAMSVQRAMALLARRHVLERRPKAGTFVGEAAVDRPALSNVHFLVPEQFITEQGAHEGYWSQIQGMRSVLPNISVQFDFIPRQDVGFTKQVVEQAAAAGNLLGVVLMLPSRAMRAWFNQSGIPTVVEGGVEADLTNLCWLNWDQEQIGRLLAGWLLGRGHRRLATVMRDVWSIGEHMLHDGIGEVMSQAGLSANALLVRSAPPERSALIELTRGLLEQSTPPTGFICRTEFQADGVSEVVKELGMEGRVDVTLCNASGQAKGSKYTSIAPVLDPVEQGRIIGTMLKGLTDGKPPEPRGRNVEVKLCEVKT
jgi:DNA-binding transcriptional regulator YhcF (GntR family)